MAKVVEPHATEAALRHQLPEPLGQPLRGDRSAILPCEDQVVVEVSAPPAGPLRVLAHSVLQQYGDGLITEIHPSPLAASGLRPTDDKPLVLKPAGRTTLGLHVDLHDLLAYDE